MGTASAMVTAETESLFRNSHEALLFAYRFASDQYDRPAMNKMAGGASRTGKGLAGLNGAAQSGMIRGLTKDLGPLHEAIVIARFAERTRPCTCQASCCCGTKPNPEWLAAIEVITQAALGMLSGKLSHYRLRRGIVMNQFARKEDKTKLISLATLCNVDRDTAADHNAIVAGWLSGTKLKADKPGVPGEIDKAVEAAGNRLLDAGFIGPY